MPLLITMALLVACSPEPPVVDGPSGACMLEDNALRPVCRFDLPTPASATFTYAIDGEPPRTLTGEGNPLVFTMWDLPPDTNVAWQLEVPGLLTRTGTTRTGSLPAGVDISFEELQPGGDAIDRLLMLAACPTPTDGGGYIRADRHLVVTDRDGVVRWYQPGPVRGAIRAYDVEPDGSAFWMVIERRTLHQVAIDGTPLLTLNQPATFPYVGHHDITSRNGQTLMIHARSEQHDGTTWVVDGLTELRDGEAHPVFSLSDVVDPRLTSAEVPGYWGFGGNQQVAGIDFGHANAIDVDSDDRWLMSFKHLDTLFALDGRPDSPGRGSLLFSIVGGERGLDAGDYRVVDRDGQPEGFEFPHHAHWLGPDRISVFDNGRPSADYEAQPPSRALTLRLDHAQGTAVVEKAMELDQYCAIQGSAFELPDGSTLVYCQADSHLWVFDEEGAKQREMLIRCPDADSVRFPRVIPLDVDYHPIEPD